MPLLSLASVPWRAVLGAGAWTVVAAGVVLGASRLGWLQSLELMAYDWAGAAAAGPPAEDRRVAIVSIDEPTIARLGWPLSDAAVADTVEAVLAGGARVVGLDLYREQPRPPGSERLARLFAGEGRLVGVTFIAETRLDRVPPPASLEGTGRVGFADMPVDPDSVVRRGLLYRDDGTRDATSLALLMASIYARKDGIAAAPAADNPDHLRLGRAVYRPLERDDGGYATIDAGGYQYLLDYGRRWPRIPVVPMQAVLDRGVDPVLFRDRAVLIGVVAPSSKDFFPAPAGAARWLDRRIVYGVELQAAATGQLLRQAYGETSPASVLARPAEAALSLAAAAIGALLGAIAGGPVVVLAMLLGGIGAILAMGTLALAWNWWLLIAAPAIAYALACGAAAGQRLTVAYRQRADLKRMFARFVDPGLAEMIWRRRDVFLRGGQLRPVKFEATVLVSDLAGFSAISAAMEPAEVMDWVGRYMDRMTDLIIDRGGMVEKYAGDGLLAVFGDPGNQAAEAIVGAARRAADCAIAMAQTVETLNRDNRARGWPELRVRIGIHSGPIVSGAVGSARRSQYTVIGDTPNIAARLEAYEKDKAAFGGAAGCCRALVSGRTASMLDSGYALDAVAETSLRGRDAPIAILRLQTASR